MGSAQFAEMEMNGAAAGCAIPNQVLQGSCKGDGSYNE